MISARLLASNLVVAAVMTFGQAPQPARDITFNGRPLTPVQSSRLAALERIYGLRLPDRAYWYDNRSGAFGFWDGPAAAVLPPGLEFGGTMPPNCSRGGTNVFINGRDLHPLDVAALSTLGPVLPGRYWLDANGNFGYQGGVLLGNLFVLASQAANRGGGGGQHRVYSPGELSGVIVNPAGACTSSGCVYSNR